MRLLNDARELPSVFTFAMPRVRYLANPYLTGDPAGHCREVTIDWIKTQAGRYVNALSEQRLKAEDTDGGMYEYRVVEITVSTVIQASTWASPESRTDSCVRRSCFPSQRRS